MSWVGLQDVDGMERVFAVADEELPVRSTERPTTLEYASRQQPTSSNVVGFLVTTAAAAAFVWFMTNEAPSLHLGPMTAGRRIHAPAFEEDDGFSRLMVEVEKDWGLVAASLAAKGAIPDELLRTAATSLDAWASSKAPVDARPPPQDEDVDGDPTPQDE